MTKNNPIITLQNIHTTYEGETTPVIHNITLTVQPGEFIAIIGPNGAGKTTLLETINGLLPYTQGHGTVLNKDIKKHSTYIRKHTGYVIQNFELDPRAPFLCKDIVMTGRTGKIGLLKFTKKQDWEIVWETLSQVSMLNFAQRPIGKLSGGEFQKILLARALTQQPQLLLLDEPFANLDLTSRRQIEKLLNKLNHHQHLTILMVLHDLQFIPKHCNRIILIDKGHIKLDDEKNKVLTSELVKQLLHPQEDANRHD